MTASATTADVKGFLALELSAGAPPAQAALRPAEAAQLVERVGRDLATLVPAIRDLDLTLAAAHFDPAEALRPGWPLHRRLQELQQRAPGRNSGPRMIAFGADEHGEVPLPFAAENDLAGGPLRVLPFLLSGDTIRFPKLPNGWKRSCWRPAWPRPIPRCSRSRSSARRSNTRAT